ncbi:MAG: hypothetical protein ABIS01_08225 [Ferruginibacter sp.]
MPDTQVSFIVELLQKFDFVKINTPDKKGIELTEAQKSLVETERSKCKNNPHYLLDWERVKDSIKVD